MSLNWHDYKAYECVQIWGVIDSRIRSQIENYATLCGDAGLPSLGMKRT